MELNKRTIEIIKQKRTVPERISEERKKFTNLKKTIKNCLKDKPKTIPQIAEETSIPLHETTYYLMTMLKFGDVVVDSIDDMDEYYYYKLK